MIVPSQQQWGKNTSATLFLLLECRGSVVPAILPKIFMAAIIGVVAKCLHIGAFGNQPDPEAVRLTFSPFTALGVAISLFLGFHNNASYQRWWEARTLWGRQVINVRNLIRFVDMTMLETRDGSRNFHVEIDSPAPLLGSQPILYQRASGQHQPPQTTTTTRTATTTINVDDNENSLKGTNLRNELLHLCMAQSHALRAQIRPHCQMDFPTTATQDRNRFLTLQQQQEFGNTHNPANAILHAMGQLIGRHYSQQQQQQQLDHGHDRTSHPFSDSASTYRMVQFAQILNDFSTVQTSIERISNTSLPLAYSLLVHRTATIYVLLAPFAMVEGLGWWTPLFSAILAYTLFGLDELARAIQDPFQDNPHCLALSSLCRTMEMDVCQALGIEPLPPKLEPVNAVLM